MKSVQLPDEIYQRVAEMAEVDNISVDKLVSSIVQERVVDWARLKARAARGTLDRFRQALSKVNDAPPEPLDQL